jgi:hypothetical protein
MAAALGLAIGVCADPPAQQQHPAAADGSAAASLPRCTFVELGTCYHGGLPGSTVQLGDLLGSGGYADVYRGTVVPRCGLQLSDPQDYQKWRLHL